MHVKHSAFFSIFAKIFAGKNGLKRYSISHTQQDKRGSARRGCATETCGVGAYHKALHC